MTERKYSTTIHGATYYVHAARCARADWDAQQFGATWAGDRITSGLAIGCLDCLTMDDLEAMGIVGAPARDEAIGSGPVLDITRAWDTDL